MRTTPRMMALAIAVMCLALAVPACWAQGTDTPSITAPTLGWATVISQPGEYWSWPVNYSFGGSYTYGSLIGLPGVQPIYGLNHTASGNRVHAYSGVAAYVPPACMAFSAPIVLTGAEGYEARAWRCNIITSYMSPTSRPSATLSVNAQAIGATAKLAVGSVLFIGPDLNEITPSLRVWIAVWKESAWDPQNPLALQPTIAQMLSNYQNWNILMHEGGTLGWGEQLAAVPLSLFTTEPDTLYEGDWDWGSPQLVPVRSSEQARKFDIIVPLEANQHYVVALCAEVAVKGLQHANCVGAWADLWDSVWYNNFAMADAVWLNVQ